MRDPTHGHTFDRSPGKPVTTREDLISLLTRASEFEHGLACAYWFAASSLKNDASEGGLNEGQAQMVHGWRRRLAAAAVERMGHLAQLSNLLSAIGAAPHLTRPTFPMPTSADSSGVGLTLEPFSQLTIERLAAYERPDTAIVAPEQQSTVDAGHTLSLDAQDSLGNSGRLEPFPIDYLTVKDFYEKIATGSRSIPAEELFLGAPSAQANPRLLDLDDPLIVVVDQASACAAIDRLVGMGEGAAPSDAGPGVCNAIRSGYAAAVADAQQTGLPFEPVRAVGSNPRTRLSEEETAGSTRLGDPLTIATADLFNGAYDKYVPQDPLLEPLFAGMSPDHPERVAAWLGEVFGGPRSYSEVFGGYSRMISQHVGRRLSEAQRARWVSLLCQSADEAGLPADPEFRSAIVSYLEWGSRIALENSQTNARSPERMPMPRWNWGTAGPPGSRISALAPSTEQEEAVALPAADESVRFAQHIKPLFRPMDRQSMKWAFDLWSYQDVKSHADGILQRLHNGSMPCDGAWSHEKVETFQRWVESGMQE